VTPYPGTAVRSALPCALLLLAGCFDFDSLDAAAKDGGADAREGSIADARADAPLDDAGCPAPDAALVGPDGGLPVKRVFVTSETWTGALGGLEGADKKCQAAANAECLGGEWKAFVSVSGLWAGDRVVADDSAFARVDGELLASRKSELVGSQADGVDTLVQITETDELVDVAIKDVWTSTDVTMPNNLPNCAGWTSEDSGETARTGSWDLADTRWGTDTGLACDAKAHVYCFEQ
jgi:hypothetical protein